MQLLLPTIRADVELAETYLYHESPALPFPITVLAGKNDEYESEDIYRAWFGVSRLDLPAELGTWYLSWCCPG